MVIVIEHRSTDPQASEEFLTALEEFLKQQNTSTQSVDIKTIEE